MTDVTDIRGMVDGLRSLAGLGKRAAPDVAQAVRAEIERSIRAGETPTGEKWAATLTGKQPLVNAAKALHVAATGGTIWIRLIGPEARHHLGWAKGSRPSNPPGKKRVIIPNTEVVPDRMAEQIRIVLDRHFDEAING